MKIVEIREKTIPISSPIRNAYIDFSKMTLSLVAVITDVIRDGKPVVGYGFNSNGRYGQGKLMRERFIPRILEANPDSLVDGSGKNLDPHKIWNTMFTNEKPGGLLVVIGGSQSIDCTQPKTARHSAQGNLPIPAHGSSAPCAQHQPPHYQFDSYKRLIDRR